MPTFLPLLSPDGYIRLTSLQLSLIPIKHDATTITSDVCQFRKDSIVQRTVYGTSEWVSTTIPCVSLSWDWRTIIDENKITCTKLGQPFSNICLINDDGQDLSQDNNLQQLNEYIDALPWQAPVIDCVKHR